MYDALTLITKTHKDKPMKKIMLQLLTTIILCMGLLHTANAVVIYDESISGDISDIPGASRHILVGVGVNSIIGTSTLGDVDDFLVEDFLVTSTPSLQITGGLFTTMFQGTGAGFYNSSLVPNFTGPILGNESERLGAFSGLTRFQVRSDTASESFTWRFDFTVVDSNAVPEPSIIALMSLGLIGFVATRRRLLK